MDNRWRDDEASSLEGIDLLVYRSRLIGMDTGLVVWGGGNTSVKQSEVDFRGRTIPVMRIKGSGADLRTIAAVDFPGIRLEDLEPLREREKMSEEEMVEYLSHCLMEPGSRRPSVETLLHGFIPHPNVDHTHPDAILALTNTQDGRRQVEAALGEDAIWIPYRRPDFTLSRDVSDAVRRNPRARCAVLEKHGLVTWGESGRESYDATIEMNTRAERYLRESRRGRAVFGGAPRPPLPAASRRRVAAAIAPSLRGSLSRRDPASPARMILRLDDSADVLDFVGSEAVPQLCRAGPVTPDHLLHTGPRPLFVNAPAAAELERPEGIARLREEMVKDLDKHLAWYETYFRKNSSKQRERLDPRPRVILIPGVGMLTAWKDAKHAKVVSDVYHHAIRVLGDAQGIGQYRSLSIKETFEAEYWPRELYKLTLAPPERELAGRVAFVTGAASGIGKAIARRLASEGCHVVATDVHREGVQELARAIVERHGEGRALGLAMDVTDEQGVAAALEETVLAYGGIDIVVSNAGIAHSSPIDRMERADWQRSFDVNATGHFLVAREATRILKEQGIGGSVIFVASKNVLAPGKDFGAYSAAKAAECQLARILAIETGESGIRVNMVNPDAIFQDSRLWSSEVREERARAHRIRVEDLEEFYRRRNLLGVKVTADDVAEAALWLASDRSAKTTGCILTIDGGVREAFPR